MLPRKLSRLLYTAIQILKLMALPNYGKLHCTSMAVGQVNVLPSIYNLISVFLVV